MQAQVNRGQATLSKLEGQADLLGLRRQVRRTACCANWRPAVVVHGKREFAPLHEALHGHHFEAAGPTAKHQATDLEVVVQRLAQRIFNYKLSLLFNMSAVGRKTCCHVLIWRVSTLPPNRKRQLFIWRLCHN
jgi:hypothetical protein